MPKSTRPARRGVTPAQSANAHAASAQAAAEWPALRWGPALLALLLGSVWLVFITAGSGRLAFPMDDPYIHFQFARNLAHGDGFSFNPGEPVPGATSPLWVLLLAGTQFTGIPAESAAIALGLLAAALTVVLTFDLGVACALPVGLAACAAFLTATSGRFIWGSLSGMETCLAAALALALVRIHVSSLSGARRGLALGALTGLAANARPELALLGALIWMLELVRSPGPAAVAPGATPARGGRVVTLLVFAGVFALAVLPYVAFSLATSGRPLPNTFYAKSVIPLHMLGSEVGALRRAYLPDMLRLMLDENLLAGVLVVPGLVMWFLRRGVRGANAVALWPLVFWAYALVLYPRHFNMSRYTIPLVPFLALLAMAPLDRLLQRVRNVRWRTAAIGAAALLFALAAVSGQRQGQQIHAAQVENIRRMQVAMGEWVAANLPPAARVAANDVGAITWYGRRYCIDTAGLMNTELVTRELAAGRRGPVDVESILAGYLADYPPDACILFPSWYPRLVRAPWLKPVHAIQFPNVTGGDNQLVVFQVIAPPVPLAPMPASR